MTKFKLVSFDMDGTLIFKKSSYLYFARSHGSYKKHLEIEKDFAGGKITLNQAYRRAVKLFTGVSKSEFLKFYNSMPKMHYIKFVVRKLKEKGLKVLIVSTGPKFIAEFFQKEFGFHKVVGSEHDFTGNVFNGKVRIFHEKDKVKFLKAYCKKNQIKLSECIAVGDSISDVPVFKEVGFSIALNADKNLEQASVHLKTRDLRKILKYVK
ncbi:MAG: HAD family phosphatase [archaeon]